MDFTVLPALLTFQSCQIIYSLVSKHETRWSTEQQPLWGEWRESRNVTCLRGVTSQLVRGWETERIVRLREFVLGSEDTRLCPSQKNSSPSDSLCGKRAKKTRIFRLCFQASRCALHTYRLWLKPPACLDPLFCWHDQKGRPQPLAVIITILLFSCLPATWASLCNFFIFFCLLPRPIHPSHVWKMHMRLMRKRRQLHLVLSLLIPQPSFLSDRGSSCYFSGGG